MPSCSRVYSLGLAIPFVLAGALFTRAMGAFRWLRDHYRAIQFAGGVLMVALGLLLFFGRFYWLRIYLNRLFEMARRLVGAIAARRRDRWRPCYVPAVATILLVGVDLFFRGRLEGLLPAYRLVTSDSVDHPDLVICDIGRVEPEDVSESWPDVPILGYTNHTDTQWPAPRTRRRLRPGDREVGARGARAGARVGAHRRRRVEAARLRSAAGSLAGR